MKLEDQITSLEWAKELRKLRLKSESFFHYDKHALPSERIVHDPLSFSEGIRAYTVTELLEMLPNEIGREEYSLSFHKTDDEYNAIYDLYSHDIYWLGGSSFSDKKAADALARLLIWCIKEGHVTIEELNKEK